MNTKEHDILQEEITEKMRHYGYIIESMTYHEKMDKGTSSMLGSIYTETALVMRTRADRLCISPDSKDAFYLEVKTHVSKRYNDMCVEMLPFVSHIAMHQGLQTECMYVFRNPHLCSSTRAFWIEDETPLMVDAVFIPSRFTNQRGYFESIAKRFFPYAAIRVTEANGSGDPFVRIPGDIIYRRSTFDELMQERMRNRGKSVADQENENDFYMEYSR